MGLGKSNSRIRFSIFSRMLLSIFLLALPWLDGSFWSATIFQLVGRLHPIIVHFPIVLIPWTVLMEWGFGNGKNYVKRKILALLYGITYASTIFAVIAGFLLNQSGDYSGNLLNNHIWGAILCTICLLWSIYFRKLYIKNHKYQNKQAYRGLLFTALIIVIYTGHQGGALTHGREFLVEPINEWKASQRLNHTKAIKAPGQMLVYQDVLLPAFKDKCISCHNEDRAKGGLVLTDLEKTNAGGKSEKPPIIPGNPEESELYRRVTLDPIDDEYMPPEGKKGLAPIEVEILRWWIANGASLTDTLGGGPPNQQNAMETYLPSLAQQQALAAAKRLERLKIGPKLTRLGFRLGLNIEIDPSSDSAYYIVSMRLPPHHISDRTLEELMPYKEVFSKISLVGADLSDEGLYYLGQMTNLQQIILLKTCITGTGLDYLKKLPKLEILNLSHSDLNNTNALTLNQFPGLKEVYLFNTFVEPNIISALDENMSDTKVSIEEGPFY